MHGSVLCSPRSEFATPMSILTGTTIIQFSHTYLFDETRQFFVVEMLANVTSPPHIPNFN